MGDREHRPQRSRQTEQAQEPEVDYVEAEHSPRAARLASLADVRRYAAESQSTEPTASQLAYGADDARRGGYLKAPTVQISTGHPLVDKGLGCRDKPIGTDGCFLDPERRAALLVEFKDRVGNAYTNFVIALTELRVDELLKKEPEKSEWLMQVILDVIGNVAISTVLKAYMALQSGGAKSVQYFVDDAGEVSAVVSSQPSSQLTTALGMAAGQGKAAATKKLGTQTDPAQPEVTTQKSANLAYVSHLKTQGNLIYQSIREEVPTGLSDSLLLTLTEAYDAFNHSSEIYKAELSAKLKRFESSGVGKIGVTRNENFHPISDTTWQHETRAYWVQTPSGRRLGLYQREHRPIPDTVREITGADRNATPFEKVSMQLADLSARPYHFVRYVPVEFEGAAIARHKAKWHGDPIERVAQTPEEVTFAGMKL